MKLMCTTDFGSGLMSAQYRTQQAAAVQEVLSGHRVRRTDAPVACVAPKSPLGDDELRF